MGEGAAMFVLERLSHAQARGARIYAEIASGKLLATAHHVTGIDLESDCLAHLIAETLRAGGLAPKDIGYINPHGTGTQQNDVAESRAIRRAMGGAADRLWLEAPTKSILGHPRQRRRQRGTGDHGAGHARWFRAADAQSHAARSRVRSRLHSVGRPQERVRLRPETFGRFRRSAGRRSAQALERCSLGSRHAAPRRLVRSRRLTSPWRRLIDSPGTVA